jgi:hypothetical protein
VRGIDLATLYACDESWSVEGRDGKVEGPSSSRTLAKRDALRALEGMLIQAIADIDVMKTAAER